MGSIYHHTLIFITKGGGSLEIARKVQQDKTKKFCNSTPLKGRQAVTTLIFRQTFPGENKNVVYESISIPYQLSLR